jgi:hypothetical protein
MDTAVCSQPHLTAYQHQRNVQPSKLTAYSDSSWLTQFHPDGTVPTSPGLLDTSLRIYMTFHQA